MSELRKALRAEGKGSFASEVSRRLKPLEPHIKAVLGIRSQSLAHNNQDMPRHKVYKIHGITPNQLRKLIDTTADVMNDVAAELGIANGVFEGDRLERATLSMLERLARGAPNKSFERTRER
jgi:hypothetical protein